MANRLAGKLALITAAGQGIGRATALRFASEGATVWATDINAQGLDALRAESSAIQARILDVRDSKAVQAVANETGKIDILFNCAGFVHQGSIFECSEKEWNSSFDLNVTSMYRTICAYLLGMLAQGKGTIINMSSIVSSLKGAQTDSPTRPRRQQ